MEKDICLWKITNYWSRPHIWKKVVSGRNPFARWLHSWISDFFHFLDWCYLTLSINEPWYVPKKKKTNHAIFFLGFLLLLSFKFALNLKLPIVKVKLLEKKKRNDRQRLLYMKYSLNIYYCMIDQSTSHINSNLNRCL